MKDISHVIIGTGACAFFYLQGLIERGIKRENVYVLHPSYTKTTHISCRKNIGGLASYWHKGFMSPGYNFLRELDISKSFLDDFDSKFELNMDHHTHKMFLGSGNYFVSQFDSRYDEILELNREDNVLSFKKKNRKISIKFNSKVVFCSGLMGNLDLCSSLLQKKLNENLSDHIMSFKEHSKDIEVLHPDWFVSNDFIAQRRPSLFPKGFCISNNVGVLSRPFGRLFYGVNNPKLALDALFKRFSKGTNTFFLRTPRQNTIKYETSASIKTTYVSAYHFISNNLQSFQEVEKKFGVDIISAHILGDDFIFFPTYTLAVFSFWKGFNE